MQIIYYGELDMPILDKLKIAVQQSLAERAWLVPAAGVVVDDDEAAITKKMSKRIVCQLAHRWQREAPQHYLHIQLATFFQKATLEVQERATPYGSKIVAPKRLKPTLDTPLSKAPSAEKEIPPSRREVSSYGAWFESELTQQIFAKLEPLVETEAISPWVSFLLETTPNDIAILISHVSNDVVEDGRKTVSPYEASNIYQWMRNEAAAMKLLSFSAAEAERLLTIGDALIDPVNASISDTPQFCLNSGGQWRLFDAETLADMQRSDQSYHILIATIDNSGPMGIEYIMTALPGDEPDVDQASDQVLSVWLTKFPMAKYLALPSEGKKQRELFFHERWLYNIDRFLECCANDALPEEVRQIAILEKQLADREEELDDFPDDIANLVEQIATMDEERETLIFRRDQLDVDLTEAEAEAESDEEVSGDNVAEITSQLEDLAGELAALERSIETGKSYVNLNTEIELIQSQLGAARTVRDSLNIEELKLQTIERAQVGVAIAAADRVNWNTLLNCDQYDPAHALTEDQFTALVIQAVDAFVARNYATLIPEESGALSLHLAKRREMQNEKRSSAEGNLRTQATASGELHILSASEVRDPLIRTLFINIAKSSDGSNFCHTIIGACLTAIEMPPLPPSPPFALPESIQEFIDTQGPAYLERAKKSYQQFRAGTLALPDEQMAALAGYGLQPAPAKPHSPNHFQFHTKKRRVETTPEPSVERDAHYSNSSASAAEP